MSSDLEAARARIGAKIADKYELLSVLGVGGMGAVYEARHAFTDRRVALKILHARAAGNPSSSARFLQEAKTSSLVDHPAIADILDAGRDSDGTLYLAFELLRGEDLGAATRGRRVSPEQLVQLSSELCDALSAAHAVGLVHRDLKPPNIFLATDKHGRISPKLLDFGIAHRAREHGGQPITQAGVVIGTLYFMSPEQMSGEEVDGRSDLWSLGVVMFYVLTQTIPFDAQNYLALLSELIQKGPRSLRADRPDLPDKLIAAVDRAVRPKVEERFQSADEMKNALQQIYARRSPSTAQKQQQQPWRAALAELERENRAFAAAKKNR